MAYVAGFDVTYAKTPRVVAWSLNGQSKGTATVPNGVPNGGNFTFSGLQPRTTYNVTAVVTYTGGTTQAGASVATSGPPRPQNWQWISTIAPGSRVQISATEWNNFCARINDFRDYKGYPAYPFSSAYSGSPISATIVMQAWNAIATLATSGGSMPNAVGQGTRIAASFFTQLTSVLNNVQ